MLLFSLTELLYINIHLLIDIDGTNVLSIPFLAPFPSLAGRCWSGRLRAGQAGDAVKSTFCDG